MKITKTRLAGATAAAAVLGAGGLQAPATSAQKYSGGPKPITIRAVIKKKTPKFVGPSRVQRGAKLTALNSSDPKKIGPHTWSLVKPRLIPRSEQEAKACFDEGVCGTIARAHKFNPKTEKITKPTVDVGRKGWDRHFGRKGDTFYTEEEGDSQTRKVTAKVGSKLTFFCAVHPNMVKKVRVVR